MVLDLLVCLSRYNLGRCLSKKQRGPAHTRARCSQGASREAAGAPSRELSLFALPASALPAALPSSACSRQFPKSCRRTGSARKKW